MKRKPTIKAVNFIRLTWLWIICMVTFSGTQKFQTSKPHSQAPNFLILLADDLGYGDLGCYGNKIIQTPHLDQLAKEGMLFTDCYASAPMCSPSRAGLLTGRVPYRTGVYDWIAPDSLMYLPQEERTIATLLKEKGYNTSLFGKWHLNGSFDSKGQTQPQDHGFDYWYATQYSPDHKNPQGFYRNGKLAEQPTGYACQIVAEEAINWLKNTRNKEKSFFQYIAFHEPHEPIMSPPELVEQYAQYGNKAEYFANVTNLDNAIGKILKALDEEGIADNTFIIFTSDNGPAEYTPNGYFNKSHGSAGALRGYKRHQYEGGIRVPGIMRWPVKIKAETIEKTPISNVGFLPTFCQLATVDLLDEPKIDGTDLSPLFSEKKINRSIPLHWHFYDPWGGPQSLLRTDQWVLGATWDVGDFHKKGRFDPAAELPIIKKARLDQFSLYDIRKDLYQDHDVADQYPKVVEELSKQLSQLHQEVMAEAPFPKPKQANRPNILLIVSEDNGPDLGCYGVEAVKSPNLDRLAEEGVLYENAFVTYSVCSPSRSTLLTGLYPHQNGQIGLATHKFRMHDDLKTLPVYLKEAGYRTGCLGKIHVNPESLIPFDFHPIKSSNFSKKKLADYAKEAATFINDSADPFFLMVNYPDAHFPLQRQVEGRPANPIDGTTVKTLPFVGADSERLREFTANYYNSMMRLDESIGMLLDSLDASGKRRETIIIYLGDHGAQFSRGKCSNYEAGLRVPFIVNWPEKIEGNRRTNDLISSIDLLPTILDVAAIDIPAQLPGISLLPKLKKEETPFNRKHIFAGGNGSTSLLYFPRRSVRDERYKLIVNLLQDKQNPKFRFYADHHNQHFAAGTTEEEIAAAPDEVQKAYACWKSPPRYELYDLKKDPHEFQNLADEEAYQAIFQDLKLALENWQESTQDPLRKAATLEKLTAEMEAVNQQYPNHTYTKDPGFNWSYLSYFKETDTGFYQNDLFADGDNGVANYRIPALVTTTKGTLLAACDARVDRRGDLPNNIDLALRRSTDHGKTWSKTNIIFDYPGQKGVGDPAMLVDEETGVIWLFFVYAAEGVGINQSKQGYGVDSTQQLMVTQSSDDGITWSEPRNITREVKKPDWYGIFFASGRGIQTRSGRLMVNLMVRKEFGTSQNDHAYVAYSDDHGKTWQASESAGNKMGESKVVELEDGTIMINMRSKHRLSRRAINLSEDGGKTWGAFTHESGLIEPTCNASIIRYTSVKDGFEKSRLLFSNPADENKRQNMAVRISYDEGKTWSEPKVIHKGPAAYSSLTVLKDGSIGLLYERGDKRADEKITFARFTLEWLTDGKAKLSKKF